MIDDHALVDRDRNKVPTVVQRNGVPDHRGDDGGVAIPHLDGLLHALAIHPRDLVKQLDRDEGRLAGRLLVLPDSGEGRTSRHRPPLV